MFFSHKKFDFKVGDKVGISFNINAKKGAQFFTGIHFDDKGTILEKAMGERNEEYFIIELDGSYMGSKLVCISNKPLMLIK